MKLIIEIPKEFEIDFITKGMFGANNKFVECFNRILSEIKLGNVKTCGLYEKEIIEMLSNSFQEAEQLKEN